MADPARVKIGVFLLCSGSGDAYTASAFLTQGEADKAATQTVASLLAKSPDAVAPRKWRHELDALNMIYRRIGQPQQYGAIVPDELQMGPEAILRVGRVS